RLLRSVEPDRDEHEGQSQRERDERTGNRDPELGTPAREGAAETGDAAEEPQRDALDLHALAPRLERVPQLVQKQRAEEEDGGREAHCQVVALRETGVLRGEDARDERPEDEREDDEPAPVDADPDSGDPAELNARLQVSAPLATAVAAL